jgi:hypothetical protein
VAPRTGGPPLTRKKRLQRVGTGVIVRATTLDNVLLSSNLW